MFDNLKWYHIEDCILCQGNGIIQIDPWAEIAFAKNIYRDLDNVPCPHCNGEGQIRTWIK